MMAIAQRYVTTLRLRGCVSGQEMTPIPALRSAVKTAGTYTTPLASLSHRQPASAAPIHGPMTLQKCAQWLRAITRLKAAYARIAHETTLSRSLDVKASSTAQSEPM